MTFLDRVPFPSSFRANDTIPLASRPLPILVSLIFIFVGAAGVFGFQFITSPKTTQVSRISHSLLEGYDCPMISPLATKLTKPSWQLHSISVPFDYGYSVLRLRTAEPTVDIQFENTFFRTHQDCLDTMKQNCLNAIETTAEMYKNTFVLPPGSVGCNTSMNGSLAYVFLLPRPSVVNPADFPECRGYSCAATMSNLATNAHIVPPFNQMSQTPLLYTSIQQNNLETCKAALGSECSVNGSASMVQTICSSWKGGFPPFYCTKNEDITGNVLFASFAAAQAFIGFSMAVAAVILPMFFKNDDRPKVTDAQVKERTSLVKTTH